MNRNTMTLSGMTIILFFFLSSSAFAQTLPEDPMKGRQFFLNKGCVNCHAIKREGGKSGPELSIIEFGETQLDLAARIWNHTPSMITGMEKAGVTKPTLTGQEFTDISAYLYFLKFSDEPGDLRRGKLIFDEKGCYLCHLPSGKGRGGAPGLNEFPKNISPVFLSQAIWNHGLDMIVRMVEIGMKWPRFRETEMMDLLEYIKTKAQGGEDPAFFSPGNPKEGKRVFDNKGCIKCHFIKGEGAKDGIDLGKVARTFYSSLTQVASSMWNKGPTVLVRMAQVQFGIPKLTSKEMADLLAYLYFLPFLDEPGNAMNGKRLFSEMGCSACHGVDRRRGTLMYINLSKYQGAPQTEIVAGIWNHNIEIHKAIKEQGLPWPQIKKGEMADLLEFIRAPK